MTTTVDASISEGAESSEQPAEGISEAYHQALAEQSEVQGAEEQVSDVTEAPPTFRVNVQGQEQEVSLDELTNGYLRQRDYTQKTQALAERQQQLAAAEGLWQALQEDPRVALEALQEHYADLLHEEDLDPVEQRLREVESFTAAQQEAAATAEINAEIERLKSEYGDFNGNELLEFAIDHEIPSLEAALTYQQALAKREADRQTAKQSAPPISTRGSTQANAVAEPPEEIGSVGDAVRAAMKELGVASMSDLVSA